MTPQQFIAKWQRGYNQQPTWLDNLHRRLDAAVAAAYGWPADLGEEEVLGRLLALNLGRAGKTG